MGKDELFENKFAGWFLRKMNAFSIKREAVGKESIQYAINLVKENKVLGIFPEGTRSKDGTPQKAKAGIALIASQTGAPIVPVSIKYKDDKAGVFKRITIRYGEIISKDKIAIQEGSRGELRRVTTLIMDAIKKQWEMGI